MLVKERVKKDLKLIVNKYFGSITKSEDPSLRSNLHVEMFLDHVYVVILLNELKCYKREENHIIYL